MRVKKKMKTALGILNIEIPHEDSAAHVSISSATPGPPPTPFPVFLSRFLNVVCGLHKNVFYILESDVHIRAK